MRCENCEDIRKNDGLVPDCETERGCPVPSAGEAGARALRLRGRLINLGPLIGPEMVLKVYGATMEDIDLIEVIEDEMNAIDKERRGTDGSG